MVSSFGNLLIHCNSCYWSYQQFDVQTKRNGQFYLFVLTPLPHFYTFLNKIFDHRLDCGNNYSSKRIWDLYICHHIKYNAIVAFVKSFSVQIVETKIFCTYGSVSLCPGYLSISLKATRIILQRNVLSHSEKCANGREQWFQMSVSKKVCFLELTLNFLNRG